MVYNPVLSVLVDTDGHMDPIKCSVDATQSIINAEHLHRVFWSRENVAKGCTTNNLGWGGANCHGQNFLVTFDQYFFADVWNKFVGLNKLCIVARYFLMRYCDIPTNSLDQYYWVYLYS